MRTEWGRDAAFTMRSFRFTSTGTSGDNNDQQQRISCNFKMIPPVTREQLEFYEYIEPQLETQIESQNSVVTQMPDCDCYTEQQCEANRSGFSARQYCERHENAGNSFLGGDPDDILCDGGLNMCHFLQYNDETEDGICENCLTLQSAQDCQERDKKWTSYTLSKS